MKADPRFKALSLPGSMIGGDFHISPVSRPEPALAFCEEARQQNPPCLILGGDDFDRWKGSDQEIFETEAWQAIYRMMKERNEPGKTTVLLRGNHNWYMPEWTVPSNVAIRRSLNLNDVTVCHGWEFDLIWNGPFGLGGISRIAFWVARNIPWLMEPLYDFFFHLPERTPSTLKYHSIIQDWTVATGIIEAYAQKAALKKGPIIFGHDHCPKPFNGLICNWGDLEDSHTYITTGPNGILLHGLFHPIEKILYGRRR